MKYYSLVTHWHLDAPIETAWEAISASEDWPQWWKYVQAVVKLKQGDNDGVGAVRRYTWSSKLPYRLSFEMRVSMVQRPFRLEGIAVGELNGTGRWMLTPEGQTTRIQYEWIVTTGKRWMNFLAPILEPVFRWNHHQVMAEGGRGLARHLGVRLLALDNTEN